MNFPPPTLTYRCYFSALPNNHLKNDGVLKHITKEPYPHDSRCGCVFCPDCKPGQRCALCDGSCVVCQGVVKVS